MDANLFDVLSLLSDALNCFVCLLFVEFLCNRCKIRNGHKYILFFSCLVPFGLNDVLFPVEYMPDQRKYLEAIIQTRNFSIVNFFNAGNVQQAAFFMSFVPIPVLDSVRSVGFIAKIVYLLTIMVLLEKKCVNKVGFYFLLGYPSLILYTSLALRDSLILLFMILSSLYMVKGRFFLSLIFLVPLYFIKFQNFYLQVAFLVIYWAFRIDKNGFKLKHFLLILASLTIFSALLFPFFEIELNKARVAMHLEDGGDLSEVKYINGLYDFATIGVSSSLFFLLRPFIWEASSALQLIQSLENMVLFVGMFYLSIKVYKVKSVRLYYWVLYLVSYSAVYGVVVSNFGTASRYKFTFVVVFVIFMLHEYLTLIRRGNNKTRFKS